METLKDALWDGGGEEAAKLEQVLTAGDGGGWEWDDFDAYRHTETGRLYWISGSGCSCSWLYDGVRGPADLEEGTAKQLADAYKVWANDSYSHSFSDTTYTRLKGL